MNVTPLRDDISVPVSTERWLTFKEAAGALEEAYGLRTTAGTLEKIADAGRGMPSSLNFGRRQVKLSQILPWLKDHGYIERDA